MAWVLDYTLLTEHMGSDNMPITMKDPFDLDTLASCHPDQWNELIAYADREADYLSNMGRNMLVSLAKSPSQIYVRMNQVAQNTLERAHAWKRIAAGLRAVDPTQTTKGEAFMALHNEE